MADKARKSSTAASKVGTRSKKGWDCPYCGETRPDEFDSLQCDTCENWVCLPCTRITEEMYKLMNMMNDPKSASHGAGIKWVCRMCDRSLPVLKEMNKTMGSIMQNNNERFDAIETQVNKLESSIGDKVSEEVSSLKDQLKDDLSAEINKKITEKLQEESDKRYREMNLCFFNVPQSKDKDPFKRKKHDEEIIYRLYETVVEGEDVEKPLIRNVFRLKQGRASKGIPVTKATFVHKSDMRQFLTYSKNIKEHPDLPEAEKKIIVSKDLSVTEREQNNQLRKELKEKNKDRNNFTIRNGRIVPRVAEAREEDEAEEVTEASGTASPSG